MKVLLPGVLKNNFLDYDVKKIIITLIISCSWISLATSNTQAQETSQKLRKLTRILHDFQYELSVLKEEYQKNKTIWKVQQDDFQELVTHLNRENKKLKEQIEQLRSKTDTFELQLELSDKTELSNRIDEIKLLLEAVILSSIDEKDQLEPLVMKVINLAKPQIPRDLLIFYLAHTFWKEQKYEKSLNYYSTLLTEYPGSVYGQRAVFEMALLLGEQGKEDDQITLLTELASSSPKTKYTTKAQDILTTLYPELQKPEGEGTSLTPDSSKKNIAGDMTDQTGDTLPAEDSKTVNELLQDQTGDTLSVEDTEMIIGGELQDQTGDTLPAEDSKTISELLQDQTGDTLSVEDTEMIIGGELQDQTGDETPESKELVDLQDENNLPQNETLSNDSNNDSKIETKESVISE